MDNVTKLRSELNTIVHEISSIFTVIKMQQYYGNICLMMLRDLSIDTDEVLTKKIKSAYPGYVTNLATILKKPGILSTDLTRLGAKLETLSVYVGKCCQTKSR